MSKTTGAYYCFQSTEAVVLTLGCCRWWWHCWITFKWSKSLIEMFDLSFVWLKLWSSTASFGFHQSKRIGLLLTTSRAGERRGRPNLPRLSGTWCLLHLPAWPLMPSSTQPGWHVCRFLCPQHTPYPFLSSVFLSVLCPHSYCVYLRVKQASAACKLKLWSAHLVRERLVCAECQSDAMSKLDRCGGDGLQSTRWTTPSELQIWPAW